MFDLFRLLLCSLLSGCALLVLFRAPTYRLWKLQVGVTEFPHVMILLSLLAFAGRMFASSFVLAGDLLSLSALFLFTYPITSGISSSRHARRQFTGQHSAFRIGRLFTGSRFSKTDVKSFTYKDGLSLDFYSSKQNGPRPCVVVIHGGGWDSGDNKQLAGLNHYLSAKGYHVAAINYRLSPAHTCPAPVEDLQDAIRFLQQRAAELYIDKNNFVLLGRSAGGQIALLHAYTRELPEVKGVIAFYAPADMVWGWSIPGNPLVLDSRATMSAYLGGTCEEIPDKFRASSPIEFANSNAPPTLLVHGQNECMVAHEHSVRLSKKLRSYGIEHYLVSLPWATHGCDYNLNGPSGQISTYAVEQFLKRVLN